MTLDQQFTPTADVCPNCATPLGENARFCPSCGQARPVPEAAPAAATPPEPALEAEATAANPTFEHAFTPATETDIDELAADTRHQRDLRPLLAIGVAIIVAVVVLILLAGGGGGYAPTVGGHKVAHPADLLKQGETVMSNTAAAQHGNTDGNSRCYYGTMPGSRDVETSLECGPVYFDDSTSTSYWMTVNFTVDPTKGVATVTSDTPATNQTLAAGEKLTRPDGKQPPKTISIKIPDPAPQSSNYVNVLQLDDPRGLTFTTPPDGRLIGPDYNLNLTGVTQTRKIGTGKGRARCCRPIHVCRREVRAPAQHVRGHVGCTAAAPRRQRSSYGVQQ